MHLHTFKRINQLDAAINYRFIVCCLDTAQHVSGILNATANSTATTTFLGKPEAAAAVDRLLIMGIRMPETC